MIGRRKIAWLDVADDGTGVRSIGVNEEVAMNEEADPTRRWLINASGAAILSSAMPVAQSAAQTVPAPRAGGRRDDDAISPATIRLVDYVANTLDRDLPAEVAAR